MASLCWHGRTVRGGCPLQRGRPDWFSAVAATRCRTASEAWLGSAYLSIGQPERSVEWCRAQLARGRDTHTFTRAALVLALMIAGSPDEAMAAATGLIDAAEATHNPYVLSYALLAYGFAFRDADPDRARDALRRGLVIAQDSGNRLNETLPGAGSGPTRGRTRRPAGRARLHSLWPSATTTTPATPSIIRATLAVLAGLFDRLGRHEPAATIAGFAFNPITAACVPEINTAIAHLRDVLGDQTYESLARKGETMTTAAMVTYAYDQIDQARAELNAVSK